MFVCYTLGHLYKEKKMKKVSKNNVSGFTLIELLVVVLIIAILSAAALPQYTRAVDKAELARIEVLVADALKAEEAYHLANRKYTNEKDDLDLQWPQFVYSSAWNDMKYYKNSSSGYTLGFGTKTGVSVSVDSMGGMGFSESYEGVRDCSKTTDYKHGEYLCNVWKNQK